jgi:hypothetical protein
VSGCSLFRLVQSMKLGHRRLVDRRILPLLGVLYAVALIDRTNLGIAYVAGMAIDLVHCSFSPISEVMLNVHLLPRN